MEFQHVLPFIYASPDRWASQKPDPLWDRGFIFVVSAMAKLQNSSVYSLIISAFNRIAA